MAQFDVRVASIEDAEDRVPLDGVAHSGPRADWRAELISRASLQAS